MFEETLEFSISHTIMLWEAKDIDFTIELWQVLIC